MQSLPFKSRQGVARLWRKKARLGSESGAVGGVAQNWVPQMGEVHANLVGAPGFQGAGEQAGDVGRSAGRSETFGHLPMSDGRAAAGADRLFVAGLRMAAKRRVDRAFRPAGRTPDESEITAPEGAFAFFSKLLSQRAVCLVGLRDDHE